MSRNSVILLVSLCWKVPPWLPYSEWISHANIPGVHTSWVPTSSSTANKRINPRFYWKILQDAVLRGIKYSLSCLATRRLKEILLWGFCCFPKKLVMWKLFSVCYYLGDLKQKSDEFVGKYRPLKGLQIIYKKSEFLRALPLVKPF